MFDFLYDTSLFVTFLMVMIRTAAIMFTAPVFGSNVIKPHIRMLFSLVFAMIIYTSVKKLDMPDPSGPMLILMIGREVILGACIGMLSQMLFIGVQLGGQIIGTQMGFGVVNVFDPQANISISIISQFMNIAMILIFIAVGGHLLLIQAIRASFDTIPVGIHAINPDSFLYITKMFSTIFITALKITAPVFITLLILQLVLGIMGRMVPQLNLMIVGFPIQISVGMTVLAIGMSYFYIVFEKLLHRYFEEVANLIRYF
ncbi:flagellar biosynthetic protein FliR [Seleniivibrio woodruffii]|uniref:flagellar biosynthetic protein FliR n=1 Tax=Seleniivibrio woodruffii TaxID=1078050 RepID=UPI0026ECF0DE|nr:flagellar biosynthetic protein FliR [Seleniivibrio woodruffii]